MSSIFSRRATLGMAAGGVAAALTATRTATAAAAPSGNDLFAAPSSLSRPDRVFLNRGLMHGAWIRSEDEEWYPDRNLWNGSGFTTPTYYNPALFNTDFMRKVRPANWSLARAPFGQGLGNGSGLPDPIAEWMTPEMLAAADELFTCCFGDEEPYSDALTQWLASAYAAMRERHPHVLVHNNQALGQYSDAQMRSYLKTTRPDLISFDFYYWQKAPYYPGGSVTQVYNQTGRYRRLAQAGLDGDGASPVAFGQYTDGFRLQPPEPIDGVDTKYLRRYFVSESQQDIVSYVTWALGGRWLDLFRWDLTARDLPWETDGLFLTDEDGNPRVQYHRYAELNATMQTLSPYLTRLRGRTASIAHGVVGETGATTTASNELGAFTPTTDPGSGIVSISATNVGTANKGKPGDVLVGTFRALPGMAGHEARDVLPDKDKTAAFMLVNAMAVANDDYFDPDSTGGSGEDTRQIISATVQPPRGTDLYRVTGTERGIKRVPLTRTRDGWQLTTSVKGGQGELYLWG